MFNRSINLNQIVKDLYPNVRRTVLLSLVGSCNAQVFNAADTAVRTLSDQGHDVTQLEVRDVEQLLAGPDGATADDALRNIRTLYLARTEWADMLAQDTGDDKLGSMESTIELLTGKQKARPTNPMAVELLKQVGVEVTENDLKAAALARQQNDQFWADQRKERSAQTEWFIDHMIKRVADDGDTEHYSQLDDLTKEKLCTKFIAALNKGLAQATQNVLTGRAGPQDLGLADIPVLRDIANRFTAQTWPMDGLAHAVDPAKVEALATKFRRAPAPTEAAPF